MTKWRTTTLGEVCDFENGDRGKNYPGKSAILSEGIPFVNAGDLENGSLRDELSYISEDHFRKLSNGKFKRGDILFCLRGTLGKFARIDRDISGAIASSLIIVRPKGSICLDYLNAYFGSNICGDQIDLHRNGAAQPNLAASSLKKFEIPLPPLDEQRRIAAILDKADALRRKRMHSIELLDNLTQSMFLKMFGNESSLVPLGSICSRVTDGTHQAPKWADSGVPFLFVSNVRNQTISFETNKFVSEEEFKRLTKNTPIDIGDVLYTAVGSYGNAAVVDTSVKFVFQRHIAQIKPLQAKVLPFFLSVALESSKVKAQADKLARGVAQKTVTLDSLKKFLVPLPPMDKQRRFFDIASAIRANIVRMEASNNQLDSVFSSLQHRAFSGQL